MTYQQALDYLDHHASYDKTGRIDSPSTATISRLCELLGEPQHCAPVIHITGTNGKGSTAQMITRLLMASGLRVGTYTSPHLERVNERFTIDCEVISDESFGEQISAIADLEVLAGMRPGYFDICTAAAFRWFADEAVDVMVIEVGLLGRWDATNVVDAQVAVITNIGLDHMEFAGPTRADIAREKAGIIKPQSVVVCGESDAEMVAIFAAADGASLLVRKTDFEVDSINLRSADESSMCALQRLSIQKFLCLCMGAIKPTMRLWRSRQLKHSSPVHWSLMSLMKPSQLSPCRGVLRS